MNRREMIVACSGAMAAAGASGVVTAAVAETPPVLLVVTCNAQMPQAQQASVLVGLLEVEKALEQRYGYKIPIVVVPEGIDLQLVPDPRQ